MPVWVKERLCFRRTMPHEKSVLVLSMRCCTPLPEEAPPVEPVEAHSCLVQTGPWFLEDLGSGLGGMTLNKGALVLGLEG